MQKAQNFQILFHILSISFFVLQNFLLSFHLYLFFLNQVSESYMAQKILLQPGFAAVLNIFGLQRTISYLAEYLVGEGDHSLPHFWLVKYRVSIHNKSIYYLLITSWFLTNWLVVLKIMLLFFVTLGDSNSVQLVLSLSATCVINVQPDEFWVN